MVIVRLMGGLGNQLFQYAAGRALAHRHGVPLKLDLASYALTTSRSFQLDAFAIRAEIASAAEVQRLYSQSPWGRTRRRLERLLPIRWRRYVRQPRPGRSLDVLACGPDVYLHGYWQSHRHLDSIVPLLREELVLREPERLARHPLARAVDGDDSVSVHVRRGDYVTDPGTAAVHGTCPPAYYESALATIAARVQAPRLFVFTDDTEWVRTHLRLPYPGTRVSAAGGLSDPEEIVLMSRCRHHVIANSSFSWWGAWLDARPDGLVVAPRRWYAPPRPEEADRVPPSWIRL